MFNYIRNNSNELRQSSPDRKKFWNFHQTHPTPMWESVKLSVPKMRYTYIHIRRIPAGRTRQVPSGRRRRSRQDSHYARCIGNAMKSVGWLWGLEDPPRFLVDEEKESKAGREGCAFNGRGPTIRGRGSCARPCDPRMWICPSIGIAFRRAGIIRLRRSVLLLPVYGALLPAYCEKTAFSTLEVATRRGLKLITVTTIGTARRGRTPADAPDARWVCVRPPGLFPAQFLGGMMLISEKSRKPRSSLNSALLTLTMSMTHTNLLT